jgi:methanogenic corrinoid protein MtbC1
MNLGCHSLVQFIKDIGHHLPDIIAGTTTMAAVMTPFALLTLVCRIPALLCVKI